MKKITITIIFFVALMSTGCSTQKMHFSEFTDPSHSKINLDLTPLKNVLEVNLVTGKGNYKIAREGSNYNWHVLEAEKFQDFLPLPYEDPNKKVKNWFKKIINQNSQEAKKDTLDIYIKTLQIKSQISNSHNYRACLIELDLKINKISGEIENYHLNGLAKLEGADIKKLKSNSQGQISIQFLPDAPEICELAIINGLRKLK